MLVGPSFANNRPNLGFIGTHHCLLYFVILQCHCFAVLLLFLILPYKTISAEINFLLLNQCDQIGRFIGLWATFSSLWQQLVLPKSTTFFGNFCKCVQKYYFSTEIIFGQLLQTIGDFSLVTLSLTYLFLKPRSDGMSIMQSDRELKKLYFCVGNKSA